MYRMTVKQESMRARADAVLDMIKAIAADKKRPPLISEVVDALSGFLEHNRSNIYEDVRRLRRAGLLEPPAHRYARGLVVSTKVRVCPECGSPVLADCG